MKRDFKEAFLSLAPGGDRFDPVIWLEETGSTNDDAKLLVGKSGDDVFAVIGADRQTSGRGTHGRKWDTPREAILMSVVIPMPGPLARMQGVTLAIGAAVAGCLQGKCFPVKVKWPNDLWLGEGKLGGILCEVARNAAGVPHLVTGIGINVSMPEGFSSDYSRACLADAGNPGEGKSTLAASTAAEVVRAVECFSPDAMGDLARRWREIDASFGREVRWSDEGVSELKGKACGIDASGRLLLDCGGKVIALQSGSVRILQA